MGIFKDFLSAMLSGSASSNSQIDERSARYTPEEFVIFEQEQSGQKWHGVLLSDLSKLARQTFRGKYVKVDEYNFLVFYYSSKSRKTQQSAQCELDENGRIVWLPHRYYPGQWRDSADDFVELANQQFTFR